MGCLPDPRVDSLIITAKGVHFQQQHITIFGNTQDDCAAGTAFKALIALPMEKRTWANYNCFYLLRVIHKCCFTLAPLRLSRCRGSAGILAPLRAYNVTGLENVRALPNTGHVARGADFSKRFRQEIDLHRSMKADFLLATLHPCPWIGIMPPAQIPQRG